MSQPQGTARQERAKLVTWGIVVLLLGGLVLYGGVRVYSRYQKCSYLFNPLSCGQSNTTIQTGFGAVVMVAGGIVALGGLLLLVSALVAGSRRHLAAEARKQEAAERQRRELQARVERSAAQWAEQQRALLEEAKRTGHLLLDDAEADAWHGVTPSGTRCHHRHRSPQAASECAARLSAREGRA